MTWTNIKEFGNGELMWRLVIEGYPVEWVSHEVMEILTEGTQSLRYVGLETDGIQTDELSLLTERTLSTRNMTVNIIDVNGQASRYLARTLPTKTTRLRQAIESTTDDEVIVDNTAGWEVGEFFYLNGECMEIVTIMSPEGFLVNRGARGTIRRFHYISNNYGAPLQPLISDTIVSPERRRWWLYVYGTEDSPQGDGHIFSRGIVKEGVNLDGDMCAYRLVLAPINEIFQNEIGFEGEAITARGYHFPERAPWVIMINESINTTGGAGWTNLTPAQAYDKQERIIISGHFETLEALIDEMNSQLAPLVVGWQSTNIQFVKFPGTSTRLGLSWTKHVTTHNWVSIYTESGFNNFMVFPPNLYEGDDDTVRSSVVNQPWPVWQIWLMWPFLIDSAFGATNLSLATRFQNDTSAGATALISALNSRMPLSIAAHCANYAYSGPTNTLLPPEPDRFYLAGDMSFIVDRGATFNGRTTMTIGDEESELALRYTTLSNDVATNSIFVRYRSTYTPEGIPVGLSRGAVFLDGAITFEPALVLVENGNFADFINALLTQATKMSSLGFMPNINQNDLDLPEIERVVSQYAEASFQTNRRYELTRERTSLDAFIAEELKLLNCIPKLTHDGRWSIAPLTYKTTPQAAAWIIGANNHLTDEGFGSWTQNHEGIRSLVLLKTGYNFIEKEHKGREWRLVWAEAAADYKMREFEIAPLSSELIDPTVTEVQNILWRVISLLGNAYLSLTVDLPLTFNDCVIGEAVSITSPHFPNPATGTRGIATRAGIVIGRQRMPQEGFVRLTFLLPQIDIQGYAPSLSVVSASGGGTTWLCQVEESKYAPAGLTDLEFFALGDRVILYSDNNWNTYQIGEIGDIDTVTQEVVIDLDGSMTGPFISEDASVFESARHRVVFNSTGSLRSGQAEGWAIIGADFGTAPHKYGP